MASFRALLPAAHGGSGIPVAALKAAATSGASFVVVCHAGGRAKAVMAALQAATKGAGLVLSTRVVACAAKRSGGVEDDRTGGEDVEEVSIDDPKAKDIFFVGSSEEVSSDHAKADDIVFFGADEDRTGEEVVNDYNKATNDVVLVGAGEDRTGKATNDVVFVGDGEMTMEELLVMFHKDTAMILRQATHFNDQPMLGSLVASCDAIGEQIKKGKVLDSPEGRSVVHSLIALHLRIVSCADGVEVYKPGSSQPEMWVGNRYRLPCKEKLAGTLMEVMLYSMMLASAAMDPFIGTVEWDFTTYD